MTSYFDHFMVMQIMNPYFTDSFLVIFFVIMLYYFLSYNTFIIPNSLQNIMEIIMDHWILVMQENLGLKFNYYILPLMTLFMFILGMNLFGFFIYTFPPTTHITISFGMAISVLLGVMMFGFMNFKSSFLSMFMPTGAPLGLSPLLVMIEMASNMSSPIALGMSLAANLTAGHMLLTILVDFGSKLLFYSYSMSNLFPIFIIMFMTGLEMGVLMIQAYVFCLLSMMYLKDSMELH